MRSFFEELFVVVHCKAWLQFDDKEPERLSITELEVDAVATDLITVDPDFPEAEEEESLGELVPPLAMVTHGIHQFKPKCTIEFLKTGQLLNTVYNI